MSEKRLTIDQRVHLIDRNAIGTIVYIGTVEPHPGIFYGIHLDEPKGKNNGSLKGKVYFVCPDNHGIFVRASNIRPLSNDGTVSQYEETKIPVLSKSSSIPRIAKPDEMQTSTSSLSGDENTRIKDLEEKLQTLLIKRAEDKVLIKDYEKMKIQLQSLLEFKKQITESHCDLQKQLAQAKKEAKEAVEEKLKFMEEMKDLAETAEIATLDKEMAEEKYEQLLKEHELIQQKLEEVTVDFELLKSEIEIKGTEGASNTYEIKQLQQQNARYNEAILKLRDLSAADKYEIHKLNKEIKDLNNEKNDLNKTKERLEKEIANYEDTVVELKEQVDDALGAQEMVEMMAERNLELEEQVKTLREQLDDLENLYDINEQLQEGARDTELELREELDMAQSKINNLQKELTNNQEAFVNYEKAIMKFRELTAQLKEENISFKNSLNVPQSVQEQQIGNIEFKTRFAESKALLRAVELELKQLELEQYKLEIKLLRKFIPSNFFIPGGDLDAIQILLFIKRMCGKCEIISSLTLEKIPIQSNENILSLCNSTELIKEMSETLRQQFFIRKLNFLMASIQAVLHQYNDSMKSCSVELYLKVASLIKEIIAQEKILDSYLDSMKNDAFDETVSLEPAQKALNYFLSLFSLHFSENKVINFKSLLSNFVSVLKAGFEKFYLDINSISYCINHNEQSKEKIELTKQLLDDIFGLNKKIKRRLVGEQGKIVLSQTLSNEISYHMSEISKLSIVFDEMRETVIKLCKEKSNDNDIFLINFEDIENSIALTGGFKCVESFLRGLMSACCTISTGFQQGDFEATDENNTEKIINPLDIRAKNMTIQNLKINDYQIKLEEKENELIELKKTLKEKANEIDEIKIRRNFAEKRLNTSTGKFEETIANLKKQLNELQTGATRKEKQYEMTLEHLQTDVDRLESERNELRSRLRLLSKRNVELEIQHGPHSAINVELSYAGQVNYLRASLELLQKNNADLKCILARRDLHLDNHKIVRALNQCKSKWWAKKNKEVYDTDIVNMEISEKSNEEKDETDNSFDSEKIENNELKENEILSDDEDENECKNLIAKIDNARKEIISSILKNRLNFDKNITQQVIEEKLERRILTSKYNRLLKDIENFQVQIKAKTAFVQK